MNPKRKCIYIDSVDIKRIKRLIRASFPFSSTSPLSQCAGVISEVWKFLSEPFISYHERFKADVFDLLACSLVIKLKIDDYASTIAQQILHS